MICGVAWRVLTGQGAEDTRSDDEGYVVLSSWDYACADARNAVMMMMKRRIETSDVIDALRKVLGSHMKWYLCMRCC
jgi:hypothetical protein